jgi:hypothetical protein
MVQGLPGTEGLRGGGGLRRRPRARIDVDFVAARGHLARPRSGPRANSEGYGARRGRRSQDRSDGRRPSPARAPKRSHRPTLPSQGGAPGQCPSRRLGSTGRVSSTGHVSSTGRVRSIAKRTAAKAPRRRGWVCCGVGLSVALGCGRVACRGRRAPSARHEHCSAPEAMASQPARVLPLSEPVPMRLAQTISGWRVDGIALTWSDRSHGGVPREACSRHRASTLAKVASSPKWLARQSG